MNEFFKWLLIILLGILFSPVLLLMGGFLVVLFELVIALIVVTSPIWIPVSAVWLVINLLT